MNARAKIVFEVEIEFNAGKFDPSEELQVAWLDPKTDQYTDQTDGFNSEPDKYVRQSTTKIEDSSTQEEQLLHAIFGRTSFDVCETWLVENTIEFDSKVIDLAKATINVVAFDQEKGIVIPDPEHVTIHETSKRIDFARGSSLELPEID